MPPIEAPVWNPVAKWKQSCSPEFEFIYKAAEFWSNHIHKTEVPSGTSRGTHGGLRFKKEKSGSMTME